MKRLLLICLAIALNGCDRSNPLTTFGRAIGSQEHVLLGKIQSARTPAEREKWIAELEKTPEQIYPFYSRWLVLHEVEPFDNWTDEGFQPERSSVPRDLQLLAAAGYGIADIENGGLLQFFGNSTGGFAPEMAEWFERAGLPKAATALKGAMAIFGEAYPRSQSERQRILEQKQREAGAPEHWDPFSEWDEALGTALFGGDATSETPPYETAANRWLRETCGITDLGTECPKGEGK